MGIRKKQTGRQTDRLDLCNNIELGRNQMIQQGKRLFENN